MGGEVVPQLAHGPNGARAHLAGGSGAGRVGLEGPLAVDSSERLGHLTPVRVFGAHEEDTRQTLIS